MAVVIEITLRGRGRIAIDRVVAAVDCGPVVHPAIAEGQVEGRNRTSACQAPLMGEVTFKDGRATTVKLGRLSSSAARRDAARRNAVPGQRSSDRRLGGNRGHPVAPALANAIAGGHRPAPTLAALLPPWHRGRIAVQSRAQLHRVRASLLEPDVSGRGIRRAHFGLDRVAITALGRRGNAHGESSAQGNRS